VREPDVLGLFTEPPERLDEFVLGFVPVPTPPDLLRFRVDISLPVLSVVCTRPFVFLG
jgi:hypothetical protein